MRELVIQDTRMFVLSLLGRKTGFISHQPWSCVYPHALDICRWRSYTHEHFSDIPNRSPISLGGITYQNPSRTNLPLCSRDHFQRVYYSSGPTQRCDGPDPWTPVHTWNSFAPSSPYLFGGARLGLHNRPMTSVSHSLSSAKTSKKCDRGSTKSISSQVFSRLR